MGDGGQKNEKKKLCSIYENYLESRRISST